MSEHALAHGAHLISSAADNAGGYDHLTELAIEKFRDVVIDDIVERGNQHWGGLIGEWEAVGPWLIGLKGAGRGEDPH